MPTDSTKICCHLPWLVQAFWSFFLERKPTSFSMAQHIETGRLHMSFLGQIQDSLQPFF